jgi:HEAT repeat protein
MLAFAKGKSVGYLARLFLLVLCAVAVWPQSNDPNANIRDMPERVLRSHHLKITEQDAIAALGSDNSGERVSAADVLSSHWPKEAVAPIEAAMLKESDQLTRVHLAWDLAKLGDDAGRGMLVSECHAASEWGTTRMLAARWMSELHDDSCADSIIEVLRLDSDPQDTMSKVEALNLVPTFVRHPTAMDSGGIVALVENALDDPAGSVRLTASQTLVRLGDISAIPHLQAAVAKEQEEAIRSAMSSDVKHLQELKKKQETTEKFNASTP